MTTRRRFLEGAAAGLGALTAPRFLVGCAPQLPPEALAAGGSAPSNPFLEWFGIDEALIRQVMSALSARGADFADLYFQHRRTNSISMEDGIIASASSSVDQGVGLRVVVGDQTGYAFTEDLTPEAMLAAAKTASGIAHGAPVEAPAAFTTHPRPTDLYSLTVPWSTIGVDRKLPLIQRLEALTKAEDSSVTKVGVYWTDSEDRVLVASLGGHIYTDLRPMARLWCHVTATRDGKTVSNSANIAGRRGVDWYDEATLAGLAKRAVERTTVLFDATRPPAGEMPVVLAAGASGILLHEAIGHGMEADFNRKGVSIYADMIGRSVAPDFVNIVDSGLEANQRGALSFDDEGSPAERTMLVEGGVLASFLHDRMSAKHYGVSPTGSGRRQSFRHAPMPRMRCTYMEPGPHSRDEIIASVERGIVAETFTNGQVQIGAGDYTFYIKNGWLIEGGKLTAPIKDVNIIGNGPESLRNVAMVGADAVLDSGGWTCGKDGQSVPVSQGLPTVLVSNMTVGGVDG